MGTSNDATNDDVRTTTEHALVRTLVEDRDGYPAHLVKSEGQGDSGLLQVGLGNADESEDLKEISWEQFFEEKDLAFAYREGGEKTGAISRTCGDGTQAREDAQ
jgi:hypothetical protein